MIKPFLTTVLFSFFLITSCTNQKTQSQKETVTISGTVTDFEGNVIDSSIVRILGNDFSDIYNTYTDKDGKYTLEIKKGKYMALFAMRPEEYPRADAVPEPDMRLEFWAWNVIADRNLVINPRYDRLELYGTTVYKTFGGYPGYFVYFRPMSLTKYLSYGKEVYMDKSQAEKISDISVNPEMMNIRVYADNELLKINSVQTIEEYTGKDEVPMLAYIVQVDTPRTLTDRPYIIFRLEAENTEHNEKGENMYFFEKSNFKYQLLNK